MDPSNPTSHQPTMSPKPLSADDNHITEASEAMLSSDAPSPINSMQPLLPIATTTSFSTIQDTLHTNAATTTPVAPPITSASANHQDGTSHPASTSSSSPFSKHQKHSTNDDNKNKNNNIYLSLNNLYYKSTMHGYFIKLGKRVSGPASEEEKESVREVFDLFQRGRGRGRGGGVGGGTCTFFKCARGGNTPDYYEVDDDTALEKIKNDFIRRMDSSNAEYWYSSPKSTTSSVPSKKKKSSIATSSATALMIPRAVLTKKSSSSSSIVPKSLMKASKIASTTTMTSSRTADNGSSTESTQDVSSSSSILLSVPIPRKNTKVAPRSTVTTTATSTESTAEDDTDVFAKLAAKISKRRERRAAAAAAASSKRQQEEDTAVAAPEKNGDSLIIWNCPKCSREFQYNHPKCVAACTNNHLKSCKGNGCSNEEEKGAHNHQDEDQSKIQNFNLLMPNKKQTKRKDTNTTTKSSPPVVQTPSRKSSRLLEASLCLPTSEDTMDASEEEEHGAGGSESDGEYDEETEEEEDESNKYTSSGKLIKAAARKAKGARNTEYLPRGITLRSTGKWQVQLYYAGFSRYIGVFDTREEAAAAYEMARDCCDSFAEENPTKDQVKRNLALMRKAAFEQESAAKIVERELSKLDVNSASEDSPVVWSCPKCAKIYQYHKPGVICANISNHVKHHCKGKIVPEDERKKKKKPVRNPKKARVLPSRQSERIVETILCKPTSDASQVAADTVTSSALDALVTIASFHLGSATPSKKKGPGQPKKSKRATAKTPKKKFAKASVTFGNEPHKTKRGPGRPRSSITSSLESMTPSGKRKASKSNRTTPSRAPKKSANGLSYVTPTPRNDKFTEFATPDSYKVKASTAPTLPDSAYSAYGSDNELPSSVVLKSASGTGLVKSSKLSFPEIVHVLISDSTKNTPELARWNEAGNAFIVAKGAGEPLASLISKYFKHRKYVSFYKQLLNYQFGHVSGENESEFTHEVFNRNSTPAELKSIISTKSKAYKQTKKKTKKRPKSSNEDENDLNEILHKKPRSASRRLVPRRASFSNACSQIESVMADHDQDTFDDYSEEEAAMAAVDAAISVNESKGAYDAFSTQNSSFTITGGFVPFGKENNKEESASQHDLMAENLYKTKLSLRGEDAPAPKRKRGRPARKHHKIQARSVRTATPFQFAEDENLTATLWKESTPAKAKKVSVNVDSMPGREVAFVVSDTVENYPSFSPIKLPSKSGSKPPGAPSKITVWSEKLLLEKASPIKRSSEVRMYGRELSQLAPTTQSSSYSPTPLQASNAVFAPSVKFQGLHTSKQEDIVPFSWHSRGSMSMGSLGSLSITGLTPIDIDGVFGADIDDESMADFLAGGSPQHYGKTINTTPMKSNGKKWLASPLSVTPKKSCLTSMPRYSTPNGPGRFLPSPLSVTPRNYHRSYGGSSKVNTSLGSSFGLI